jgi:hypothetical protein
MTELDEPPPNRGCGPMGQPEVKVEFAVKISADSNVIIARVCEAANFRIALRWRIGGAVND